MKKTMWIPVLVLLAGCVANPPAKSYKPAEGAQFEADREACMKGASVRLSDGQVIPFGGNWNANLATSRAAYVDCMVARGYREESVDENARTGAGS